MNYGCICSFLESAFYRIQRLKTLAHNLGVQIILNFQALYFADGIFESNAKIRSSANWWNPNTVWTFSKSSIKTHPGSVEVAQQERKNKHCKQLRLPIIPRPIVKIIIKQESNYAEKGTRFLSGKYAFTSKIAKLNEGCNILGLTSLCIATSHPLLFVIVYLALSCYEPLTSFHCGKRYQASKFCWPLNYLIGEQS